MGAEETPSTMQSRDTVKCRARALATEQKRNVHQPDELWCVLTRWGGWWKRWNGWPTGARANRRLWGLREARVARLVECCLKQKMGYGRHANLHLNSKLFPTVYKVRTLLHYRSFLYSLGLGFLDIEYFWTSITRWVGCVYQVQVLLRTAVRYSIFTDRWLREYLFGDSRVIKLNG